MLLPSKGELCALTASTPQVFAAAGGTAEKACALLTDGGVPAAVIGEDTDQRGVVELVDGKERSLLPLFGRDEIIKLH